MHDIRRILVHLDGPSHAAERLAVARRLALAHGAQVAVLYAAVPVTLLVPYPVAAGAMVASSLAGIDGERRSGARQAFEACFESPGVDATWAEVADLGAEATFAHQALYADLAVLGQRDPDEPHTGGVAPGFVELVLARSGRPALLLPFAGVPAGAFDTVAIAWKETPEAARAVAAALPLLRQARHVHAMTWSWQPPAVHGTALDLPGWLQQHGIAAQWHREGADGSHDIGERILSRCADLGAELLVMGCYGHARAREWLLGGASRTVLRAMTLPVLMCR
jgi:nucleotide-binding universal stress UspA family protein